AEAADTVDCRWFERHHDRSRDTKQFWRDASDDIAHSMALGSTFLDGIQRSEDESIIGRTAAGEREPGNGEGSKDIGIGAQYLLWLLGDVGGVSQRCALWCLHNDNEIVLILLWHKPCGNVDIHVSRHAQRCEEKHDHRVAKVQYLRDHFPISDPEAVNRS